MLARWSEVGKQVPNRKIMRISCLWIGCAATVLFSCLSDSIRIGIRRVNDDELKMHLDILNEKPEAINCTQPICTGPLTEIYCGGPIIQMTWLFGMHQSCPGDMMRHPADTILREFNKLKFPLQRETFEKFCSENFASISYLKTADLIDWTEEPTNIKKLKNIGLKNFTSKLNLHWKILAKEFVEQVFETPDRFPVLPVKHPFIVPGGGFEIYFYWDTYWIAKEAVTPSSCFDVYLGLLFSGMNETVRLILKDLASLVEYHGFIPNSGNIELSRRSQPPLLTQMVADYFSATKNKTFLKEILPSLEKEMLWWQTNRKIVIKQQSGEYQTLFQYRAVSNCPRPENYLVDLSNGMNGTGDARFIWSSIASACESGSDFTTRWFAYSGKYAGMKKSIRTNAIIPVDLNVFMAMNFDSLANFYDVLGMKSKATKYRKYATKQRHVIDAAFWNETDGVWYDYDHIENQHRQKFYVSNMFPLLLRRNVTTVGDKISKYLLTSGALDFKGGIPETLNNQSNEQWDFPNGWPPHIHLFVESMRLSGHKKLMKIGAQIAQKFITTVYNGLMNPVSGLPSACWEKYDVRFDDGRPGIGGEYAVQQGFGWTNGAVLDLIYKYFISSKNYPF